MEAINILKEFSDEAIKSNDIDAIVLSGSKTSLINDEMSDYDIYIYSKERINIETRKNFSEKYSSYYELGNDYFEYGDELIIENICFDFMYRDLSFVENEINYIWKNCNSKIGYTTAFLYNIKNSKIIYDKDFKFKSLQEELNKEYPNKLKENIINKNLAVMKDKKCASFFEQLEKAIKRKDIISVNHRITAILSSYFDILFALNKELHPGEKKLIKYAHKLCKSLPKNFDNDIENIINSKLNKNILDNVDKLIENLKKLFKMRN